MLWGFPTALQGKAWIVSSTFPSAQNCNIPQVPFAPSKSHFSGYTICNQLDEALFRIACLLFQRDTTRKLSWISPPKKRFTFPFVWCFYFYSCPNLSFPFKKGDFFFSNLKLQHFHTKPKSRHLPKPITFLPVSSTARSKPFHDHLCAVGPRWGAFLQEREKKTIISQPDWPDCRDKATRHVSSLLCNDFLKVVA